MGDGLGCIATKSVHPIGGQLHSPGMDMLCKILGVNCQFCNSLQEQVVESGEHHRF